MNAPSGAGSRRLSRGLAIALFALQLIVPAVVLATQSWTITYSPTAAIPEDTLRIVTVTVTNTSTENGGSERIGCVRLVLPASFAVSSVSVVSVTHSLEWSATMSGTGPTTVDLRADGDSEVLRGSPDSDRLVFSIVVTPSSPGTFSWVANEFEKKDCTRSYNQTQLLSFSVNQTPTSTSTPNPTLTATPRPTPTRTITPNPTPTPVPGQTPDPSVSPAAEPTPTPSIAPASTPAATPPPVATPTPGLAFVDVFHVGGSASAPIEMAGISLASALLGNLDAFTWAVPGLALSVPGLIVIAAILAQTLGGLAWLPIARRTIGQFGLLGGRRRRRSPRR